MVRTAIAAAAVHLSCVVPQALQQVWLCSACSPVCIAGPLPRSDGINPLTLQNFAPRMVATAQPAHLPTCRRALALPTTAASQQTWALPGTARSCLQHGHSCRCSIPMITRPAVANLLTAPMQMPTGWALLSWPAVLLAWRPRATRLPAELAVADALFFITQRDGTHVDITGVTHGGAAILCLSINQFH